MKRRSISFLLTFLLACFTLAGCGQSKPQSFSKESTSTVKSTSTEKNSSGDSQPVENSSNAQEESTSNSNLRKLTNNKITINIGKKTFTVDLYDNPTAKDLLSQLPLTFKVNNYPGYDEKVIRLSNPLSMEGAPHGDEPGIPEVGYYEPGRWIAIYYGHIGYWPGKVPLGRIHASVDELREIPDNASVTIEIVKD